MTRKLKKEATEQRSNRHDSIILKLFNLGYVSKGGVNPSDLLPENMKSILSLYFPDRNYSSFAPLCRRKVRELNIYRSVTSVQKAKGKLKWGWCYISFSLYLPFNYDSYFCILALETKKDQVTPKKRKTKSVEKEVIESSDDEDSNFEAEYTEKENDYEVDTEEEDDNYSIKQ